MKTHTIKTPTAELLIVELPEAHEIIPHDNGVMVIKDSVIQLEIKGSYTLLGKPDEISEDHAKELVNLHESGYYKDYINLNNFFTLPSKSLLSLLESEIYWENPYDKSGMTFANEYKNRWEEAELRTFDRSRTLIFLKQ